MRMTSRVVKVGGEPKVLLEEFAAQGDQLRIVEKVPEESSPKASESKAEATIRAFQFAQAHGFEYKGDNWGEELEALRALVRVEPLRRLLSQS